MTSDAMIDAAARALNKMHAEDAGGCFAPSGVDTPDDCVEGTCYCWRECKRQARAALDAASLDTALKAERTKALTEVRELVDGLGDRYDHEAMAVTADIAVAECRSAESAMRELAKILQQTIDVEPGT